MKIKSIVHKFLIVKFNKGIFLKLILKNKIPKILPNKHSHIINILFLIIIILLLLIENIIVDIIFPILTDNMYLIIVALFINLFS